MSSLFHVLWDDRLTNRRFDIILNTFEFISDEISESDRVEADRELSPAFRTRSEAILSRVLTAF